MANSVITAENLKDTILVTVDSEAVIMEVIKIPTVKGDFVLP